MLERMGVKTPTARKTGTTIAGLVFKVKIFLYYFIDLSIETIKLMI